MSTRTVRATWRHPCKPTYVVPASTRIGFSGTGFIARQVADVLRRCVDDLSLSRVLSRRPKDSIEGFDASLVTDSPADLAQNCDIVFEASGDAIQATRVVEAAIEAERPVVTMNSEFHVTTGTAFVGKGYVTETLGDQPGCQALLYREVKSLGFDVRALVNIKGFLNPDPPLEDMKYWAARQQLALDQTISFTDGSKLQIEQALVANGLGAAMAKRGFLGGTVADIKDSEYLGDAAIDRPVSDYVVCAAAPPGVFILATHPVGDEFPDYSPYAKLKTANGKYFLLLRPYHLCALEVVKSLRDARDGAPKLLDNGPEPHFGVAAIAKQDIAADTEIDKALGSNLFRGEAVGIAQDPDHVPICLIRNARLTRPVSRGQAMHFDDVELPASRALELYETIRKKGAHGTSQIAARPG